MKKFRLCLPNDTGMENYVGKVHRNISTKKIYRCFRLYLSILW